MVGAGYIGKPRPAWKTILFNLVTFGIYGRVYLYKTAKELDGHGLLFLDLRLFLVGVILPFGGPLVVKWRLVALLHELVRHDVTARRVSIGGLRWAGLVPWFPLFAVLFQRHLAAHWDLHRKMDEVEALAAVIDEKRKKARSKAALEQVAALENEHQERKRSLDLAREAALALREAAEGTARAERELREAERKPPLHRRFSPTRLWSRRRPTDPSAEGPGPLGAAEETEPREADTAPAPRKRLGPRSRKEEPGGDEAAAPTGEAEAEPNARGLFSRFRKRAANGSPEESAPRAPVGGFEVVEPTSARQGRPRKAREP